MKVLPHPIASAFLLTLATASCMGDMAVKLKGSLVDSNGVPRERCSLVVKYLNQVSEWEVSSSFEQTLVFRPTCVPVSCHRLVSGCP